MRVGLVGFPRSGRTTLFAALTGLGAGAGTPGDRRGARIGVIKVPDLRLRAIANIVRPEREVYAEVTVLDFPAEADGAAVKGAIDPQALAQMRTTDALAQVVRVFVDPLSLDPPRPVEDVGGFHQELVLADLLVVEKRLERLRKERGKEHEQELLERCRAALERAAPLRSLSFSAAEEQLLSGFAFLSQKPMLIVANLAEEDRGVGGPARGAGGPPTDLAQAAEAQGLIVVPVCAKIEAEIAELPDEEQRTFREGLGVEESARDRFIASSYRLLGLLTFFTTGSAEVRAWPIRRGTTALAAAGKVHTDMERGFIRAEVTAFDDYVGHGGEHGCREAGKLRLEGKDYLVQDGDVIRFRFKV